MVVSNSIRLLSRAVGRVISSGSHELMSNCSSQSAPQVRSFTSASAANLDLYSSFQTLKVQEVAPRVINVEFNRPEVRNALSNQMFAEIKNCFELIHFDKYFRSVVLTGSGKLFCSGIDLMALQEGASGAAGQNDPARKALTMKNFIEKVQSSVFAIYKCQKPIVAAVQPGAVGGAIDILGAVNIRYASADAWFSIKEVDVGIAPDIGTLQFLPPAIGNLSLFNELVYTGRKFDAIEAKELGLISKILPDIAATKEAAIKIAALIATKSPVAVQGTKHCLQYSREHSVEDSLRYQSVWNMTMLQSEDTMKAAINTMTKSPTPADFEDF